MFAECLGRAPNMILLNANYVTKVVFPLEMLPLTAVLGSLVHLLIGFVPLSSRRSSCATDTSTPPSALAAAAGADHLLGAGHHVVLSALGAFLRDLNEVMLALTKILMYASAVFYPFDRVPPEVQLMVRYNPLAFFSEAKPQSDRLGQADGVGAIRLGALRRGGGHDGKLLVFMRVKHAFADVI